MDVGAGNIMALPGGKVNKLLVTDGTLLDMSP
jgi:hypothetical protein